MKATLRLTVFGYTVGSVSLDVEGHGEPAPATTSVPALLGKLTKGTSRVWIKGMLS
ncbi:hypothetical protein SEA_PAOLA_54 [Mycobacterium phage Paola]|uniref:Uncharacterized protein n=3 Tax=Kratiovirus TaxID=2948788 RepID=A0A1C9EGT5_9CAUD|nr:hypothetical protein SEA_GENGAR_54 [Mycobacterium phage Gengar]YP_009950766.1 hypothetical protein I5G73_gp45 [Mycobacterium phage Leston]YP_009950860.1 hypothetical protein I5G74_gp43 [Mycobacterium phage Paola]ASR85842.1 hypothetical protein SEA_GUILLSMINGER_55 [Mycobacterium phage Guillsminger]AON96709.1 hypothetical protein SEA_GENGAR_54 [Mycobacterium phage Gengar]AVO25842.1 hypothetical protein SEA_PAOLA_54 [Mycobacterium phage Paola]AVR77092.1 hypothetical protein SEA_LESTON_54 [Myc